LEFVVVSNLDLEIKHLSALKNTEIVLRKQKAFGSHDIKNCKFNVGASAKIT
jgi:hypothetical protein